MCILGRNNENCIKIGIVYTKHCLDLVPVVKTLFTGKQDSNDVIISSTFYVANLLFCVLLPWTLFQNVVFDQCHSMCVTKFIKGMQFCYKPRTVHLFEVSVVMKHTCLHLGNDILATYF